MAKADELLIVCLCAAWCGACRAFTADFDSVARAWPQARFSWIDIEDHPEVLGDDDVETFPTLLVADAKGIAFYGAIEPRASILDTLILRASGTSVRKPLTEVARRASVHATGGSGAG